MMDNIRLSLQISFVKFLVDYKPGVTKNAVDMLHTYFLHFLRSQGRNFLQYFNLNGTEIYKVNIRKYSNKTELVIKTRNSLGKCFSVSINQMRSRVISTWTPIPLDFFQWTENSPPAGQAVSQWLPFLDLEAKNIVIQTYGIYWVQRIFFTSLWWEVTMDYCFVIKSFFLPFTGWVVWSRPTR